MYGSLCKEESLGGLAIDASPRDTSASALIAATASAFTIAACSAIAGSPTPFSIGLSISSGPVVKSASAAVSTACLEGT